MKQPSQVKVSLDERTRRKAVTALKKIYPGWASDGEWQYDLNIIVGNLVAHLGYLQHENRLMGRGVIKHTRMQSPTSHRYIRGLTIARLKEQGEPSKCERCGGKPGEASCGKIIHEIMLATYEQVKQELAIKGGYK